MFVNSLVLIKSSPPNYWFVYDGLAEAYFMMGDFDKALKNYQTTIELNSKNQWDNNTVVSHIIQRIKKKKQH